MDLERSLSEALEGLVPEPPSVLLPGEVETMARKRVRRQRVLAAVGSAAVVALASVAVASYQEGSGDRPGPAATPSGEPSASPSAFPVTTTSVELTASGQLGPDWVRDAVIRYGPKDDELGVDTSDSSCPPGCGPDSAAPGPDGTWWVLDSVKHRLAEFGLTGQLKSTVDIPPNFGGRNAQGAYATRVLDDGAVVLDNSGRLLVARAGVLSAVPLDEFPGRPSSVVADDGRLVYTDHGVIQAVDVSTDPAVASNDPLRLRDGTPFSISGTRTEIVIDWLEEGSDHITRQTRLDIGESFGFTWAAKQRGLVLLINSASSSRARIVHLDVDGTVSTEKAPDPYPVRMSGLPTLRTNSLDWIGLALAEADGLHLYHRLSPGAVALNGHTCTSPAPPTTDDTGRPITKLGADLDGDRRPDQVVSHQASNGQYVYQAVLADGRTTDPQTSKDVFPDEGYGEELLGVHDFDGDGRDEVLLRAGGNTADSGGIARLKGCQLVGLDDSTTDVTFTFFYGAHSNCCPDTHVLVTCEGAHLIETTSRPEAAAEEYAAMTDAQRAQLRRTWERNVYLVEATSAHRISHITGRTAPGKDVIPAGQSGVRC